MNDKPGMEIQHDPNVYDHRHPQFRDLCAAAGIEYTTTVHHFDPQDDGSFKPVLWGEAEIQTSERVG